MHLLSGRSALGAPGRLLVAALPLACLAYAVVAILTTRAWISAAAALVVTWLLWRRHPRARFAAYIFFSGLALRGVTQGDWLTLGFALAAVGALQAAPARARWPRLTAGFRLRRR
jgi:hypothetical protein